MTREPLYFFNFPALHLDRGIKMLLGQCTNCPHSLEMSKVNDKQSTF